MLRIILAAAAVAATFVLTPASADAWVFCANEGEVCKTPEFAVVRYGIDSSYRTKLVMNSVGCSNSAFGDPIIGAKKSCYYHQVSPRQLATSPSWTLCANEGERCKFDGLKKVKYGAGQRYRSQYSADGIDCSNSVFGDPASGIVKHCYVADVTVQR
jgi:hypothetical protein